VSSPAGALGIDVVGWDETDDPYALTASLVRAAVPDAERIGLSDRTWVMHGLRWRDALPGVRHELAGAALRTLRMRKTPEEVAALREAARIIDGVQERIQGMRLAGRAEQDVGREIADLILAGGNATVNFVIVGSGPNGASPHHDLSGRVIERGDAVVFDIGGTTPDGYCSDITRTYVVGEVPDGFDKLYAVLQEAQEAACDAVRPGITGEQLDAVARDVITDAGFGEFFIHRTGHGIGLEEHEEPYIVSGNTEPLEPGMAFSIEPGIYLPDRHGARIEDIVVCTEDGGERLNLVTRDLLVLDA
jgi:Xaa-Pro aminopeptidase